MKPIYDVEQYETVDGKVPFGKWLLGLRDKRAKAKLRARIKQASFGNFGDWKSITGAKGISEMREHYGPGYRMFYSIVGKTVLLLLVGSDKKDQKKAITKAKKYLKDYKDRTKP